jgi:Cu/Ag efflux protein CusF
MKQDIALAAVAIALMVPSAATAQSHNVMSTGGEAATPDMAHRMQGLRASPAMASMSEGEVRKADAAAGKLTLRHGPLEHLDMPAMTMVFRVKDPSWVAQPKVGDEVRFVAERVDGNLTVTVLQRKTNDR